MSKARLVITAVTVETRPVSDVARAYGVTRSWIYTLLARYRAEGEAAFEPRSRRPKTSPAALGDATVDLIMRLRKDLAGQGLDAGPHTICWHLRRHHQVTVSAATISRYLTRHGLVVPEPRKRPKSSYLRFAADLPNECWQSDFTHYRLTRPGGGPGADTEILAWLDDHSRLILCLTCHQRVTGAIVVDAFRAAAAAHGAPASSAVHLSELERQARGARRRARAGGLLATERECQAGKDEGQEKDRQDALSGAAEGDDFVLGDVEGLGSAGVSAVADLQDVTPGFDRYVDGLVHFNGPGRLSVDHDVVRAATDLRSDSFVHQPQRCRHCCSPSLPCERRSLWVLGDRRHVAATVIHGCGNEPFP